MRMAACRKTLQVLQPSAADQRQLVGDDQIDESDSDHPKKINENVNHSIGGKIRRGNNKENEFNGKSSREKSLPKSVVVNADKSTNTVELKIVGCTGIKIMDNSYVNLLGSPQQALQWMTEMEPTENYWQVIAEQRRLALEESLKENEQLHRKNNCLCKENAALYEVNEAMQEMALKGERLAEMLLSLDADERGQH